MKKIAIALIAAFSASSWLAAADLVSGGKTVVVNTATTTGASGVNCDMVSTSEVANIQLSKDVVGAIDCTSTAAGVATAHPGGKGRTYGASSNGGKLAETGSAEFANAAAAQAAAGTAATAARNAS